MPRIMLLFLGLLLGSAHAQTPIPSLEDRSPVLPGLWWTPDRPGHGVEIQLTHEGLFLVWYTHREDRSPVWYSAQGALTEGRFQGELYEHRWAQGAHAGYEAVGSLALDFAHPEAAVMTWSIGGHGGTWPLVPFAISGTVAEIDHSGVWFHEARPGYGLSLSHQGQFLFGVLYVYDAQGQPTWRFGNNGDDGVFAFAMHRVDGACPWCPSGSNTYADAGRIELAAGLEGELAMSLHGDPSLAEWILQNQPLTPIGVPPSARRADRMLVRIGNADALAAELRNGLLATHGEPWPRFTGIDFSAPPPPAPTSPEVSSTNVQVEGVDEASLLLYADGRVHALEQGDAGSAPGRLRSAWLDPQNATLGPVSFRDIEIDPALEAPRPTGLMHWQDRLVAVHNEQMFALDFGFTWFSPFPWTQGRFQVDILPVESASFTPWRAVIDGHVIAVRRVEGQLILLHRYTPDVEGLAYSGSDPGVGAANADRLGQTPLHAMLPTIRIDGGEAQALVGPDQVLLPPTADRQPRPDMMLLTRIDIADPAQRETLAVVGYLDAMHVTPSAAYLASSRYAYLGDSIVGIYRSGKATTDIHRIDFTESGFTYRGSGSVEGILSGNPDRASFRMGEHDGRLHVVTESWDPIWGAFGRHRLSTLEPSGIAPGLLRTVAILPNAARPQPIGKPDELLYATRFVGDRLYAVTFLNIDPLYVIDLADPEDPRIAGEVELTGFSDYLHPLPGGLLLGVGLDAVEEVRPDGGAFAWFQGIKFSLFDVSDPAAPQVIQEAVFGRRGSGTALLDHHHAFSILPGDGQRPTRFAIPMALHGADMPAVPGAPPHQHYPWTYSGQFRFALEGEGAETRIVELDPLITRAATSGDTSDYFDGARRNGRSLLFDGGSLYLDADRFWLADWNSPPATSGPH